MIKNFDEIIKDEVLVDFYADWCGPCKILMPILEEIKNIKIVKVNVDQNHDLAKEYGVMSIPTLMIFKNSNLLSTKVGYITKEELEKWIKETVNK